MVSRITRGSRFQYKLDWFVAIGAASITCLGAAVLLGWVFDIAALKGLRPDLETMKVNTAIAFVSAGVSLGLLHYGAPSGTVRLARILALFVAAIGGTTLVEDIFGLDLSIDQLVSDTSDSTLLTGRMALATAFNFVLIGLALFFLKARQSRLATLPHWFVVPPLFISALALVGYAFGVSSLYQIKPFSSVALHTGLLFLILGMCIVAEDTDYGWARIAISDTNGGMVCRLLPAVPLVMFLLGWAGLLGEQTGLYDDAFGRALMTVVNMTICVAAVSITAVVLHRIDLARLHAERALVRASQLATMGEMAVSVAHEINQPLAAIATNGDAALRWLGDAKPDLDEVRGSLECVVSDAHRASQVIQTIRSMVTKGGQKRAPVDVNELLLEVLGRVQDELEQQRVSLRTELEAKPSQVVGDRVQLQQLVLNLLMNAIDAMGSITERARTLRVRSETNRSGVVITVEDSGVGIDPKGTDRIFDAFYTTKPHGMGIGLAICRSIVEAHGGRISAAPGAPHGSVFQVILPMHEHELRAA